MRAWMLALIALTLALQTGCAPRLSQFSNAAAQIARFKPRLPESRPDVVELHYIFLTTELNDPKITEDVWQREADEQCIGLDVKAAWAQNGLRIGKLGSRLPQPLLDLLAKDGSKETGRRHHATSGQLTKVQMTEVIPSWNVFRLINGHPAGDEIHDAQGFLYVTPTVTSASSAILDLVPEIEYGPKQQKRIPTPDLAGWQLRTERDSRKFPEMQAKIELAAGEYVLIGTSPETSGSLGQKMLIKEIDGRPRQTLLLIRVAQPHREELLTAGYDFDDFFLTPIKKTASALKTPVVETVMASKVQDAGNAN